MYELTDKQKQLFQSQADGESMSEIMLKMNLSRSEINRIAHNAINKNNFDNRIHAVAELIRKGIID